MGSDGTHNTLHVGASKFVAKIAPAWKMELAVRNIVGAFQNMLLSLFLLSRTLFFFCLCSYGISIDNSNNNKAF